MTSMWVTHTLRCPTQIVTWRLCIGYSACAVPPPWRGSRAQSFLPYGSSVPTEIQTRTWGLTPSDLASPILGLLSPMPPSTRVKEHSTMYYPQIELSMIGLGH